MRHAGRLLVVVAVMLSWAPRLPAGSIDDRVDAAGGVPRRATVHSGHDLAECWYDDATLMICPGRPTTTKERLVGLAQHRHRQQLLRVDEEETAPLAAADQQRLLDQALSAITDVDAVCIETMIDLAEAKLAVRAVRAVSTSIPVMATLTFDVANE